MFSEVTVASASQNFAATAVQDIGMVLDGTLKHSEADRDICKFHRITRELPFPIRSASSSMIPDHLNLENLLTSEVHKEKATILLDPGRIQAFCIL